MRSLAVTRSHGPEQGKKRASGWIAAQLNELDDRRIKIPTVAVQRFLQDAG